MSLENNMPDLQQLKKIAKEQGNKLNLSLIMITLKANEEDLQEALDYLKSEDIEILNSDIEPDNSDALGNISPFDPSKIDIKMDKLSIDSLIKRIVNNEIEFDSEFQRKAGLWKNTQKSQLIESILLKIPLPAFYFDASDDDRWLIIDGLQRVTAIKEYVVEKTFKLEGMEFLSLNGLTFDQLPRSLQRRIEETNINAYLVNPATPANVKFNIFKRINTGGLTLEPQEIRNALFQGKATQFLKELACLPIFSQATGDSIKGDRMMDREFCLRFVAFVCRPLEDYSGIVDDFLNNTMIYLNKTTDQERNKIKEEFILTLNRCYKILGKYAFRKMALDGRRRPVNKALFEGWSNVISKLDEKQSNSLIQNKAKVRADFIRLCDAYSFTDALRASDKRAVSIRIKMIKMLVDNILKEVCSYD